MDLRDLPPNLDAAARVDERRVRIEKELDVKLDSLQPRAETIGHADEKNCEQMFGAVPIPVGYAGPLTVQFSDGTETDIHLPLATTEGALVASVNRGCKAASLSMTTERSEGVKEGLRREGVKQGGVRLASIHHGITRSIALRIKGDIQSFTKEVRLRAPEWTTVAEATSDHLHMLDFDIDEADKHVFLTLACDTDEAMGMNMVTIAASAVGDWLEANISGCTFITVAANVDSDKKPSLRTYDRGRGFEVIADVILTDDVIANTLKSSADAMMDVARAKLELGSEIAGAIGRNLHAANIVAALYLATGQDAAHVVEGSLSDTIVERVDGGLHVTVRMPAVIVGVRGGGTTLPAQSQALALLLSAKTGLKPRIQLAESIGAAVLAGEISLLAAQASHHLAKAHKELGR